MRARLSNKPICDDFCRSIARVALVYLCLSRSLWAEELSFNRDIRPILSENCFYCHGQDSNKREADLRLDLREAAFDAGVIVAGDADASRLIQRILSDDPEEQMPPPKSNRKLSKAQKKTLERWIREGAEYEQHWAFSAPKRPAEPKVEQQSWGRTPIDRFVLAKLEAAGVKPSPEADRATLIRRLSIDLIGLPPTPAEVDTFVADTDPQAYDRLVERLLSSQHYGERMAIAWLDALAMPIATDFSKTVIRGNGFGEIGLSKR